MSEQTTHRSLGESILAAGQVKKELLSLAVQSIRGVPQEIGRSLDDALRMMQH